MILREGEQASSRGRFLEKMTLVQPTTGARRPSGTDKTTHPGRLFSISGGEGEKTSGHWRPHLSRTKESGAARFSRLDKLPLGGRVRC